MTDSQRWLVVFSILFLGVMVYFLSPVLIPFVLAALLAYFFNPVVDRLATWHIPRVLAVIIVFVFIIVIVFCLIFLIVPLLEKQIVALVNSLPALNKWITTVIWPWVTKNFNINTQLNLDSVKNTLTTYLQNGNGVFAKLWAMVSHSGFALISFFSTLILIPVVTFYLLCDWDHITKAASKLLPRHSEKNVVKMIRECGDVLAAFFRGQLLVMISLGIIYAVGLWMIGLDVGLLIGFLAGLLSIVPYLGFISGIVMAIFAAFLQFHDVFHIVLVIGVFSLGEVAESFILIPWLVGDRVGLHPVAVIFAVLAFGQLFGFVGILLAVPVSAVIMVFMRHLYSKYVKSDYYT